jgi:hypothetical protein
MLTSASAPCRSDVSATATKLGTTACWGPHWHSQPAASVVFAKSFHNTRKVSFQALNTKLLPPCTKGASRAMPPILTAGPDTGRIYRALATHDPGHESCNQLAATKQPACNATHTHTGTSGVHACMQCHSGLWHTKTSLFQAGKYCTRQPVAG